jgi:hypothetical protein
MGLYGLREIPQSNLINPAFIPEGELIIGIPFLSSISHSTYSSSFSFNDIFIKKAGSDSLYLNLSSIASKNYTKNFITGYVENDIIYFGLKIKKNGYLSSGIRNRVYSRVMYSTDMIKLLWNGNGNYIGEKLDLTNTFINHDHFLSYYVGYSLVINKNVSLGLRANLNQGLSSIQTVKNELTMRTSAHSDYIYNIDANTGFLVNTSGIVGDSVDGNQSITEYVFNFNNIGFSIDFGGDFKVSERIKLNVSVVDLGFISWKSNLRSYENTNDSVQFSGIYNDININEDVFQAFADSLNELFEIKEFDQKFKTILPTRIYFGIEYYSLNKKNRYSFLFSGIFLKESFSSAFSLGYDRTISERFTFKVNYTYLKYAPLNIGAGLVLNLKPIQIYLITDNILSGFYWSGQKYFNFRFGINLVFAHKRDMKKVEADVID